MMEEFSWSKVSNEEPEILLKPNGLFHIGQCYDDTVADTVFCAGCGGNEFYVGRGSHYTAIKCKMCEWELCIHDG